MKRHALPRRPGESGQALVEFALVLPLILLLLFGMLQFALVLNARQTVASAAQAAANGYAQTRRLAFANAEAARAGAQLRPVLSAAGTVDYSLISGSGESRIRQDGAGRFGDFVAARVTYRYPSPVRAALGPFRFSETIPLALEAVARIEAPPVVAPSSAATPAAPQPVALPGAPPTSFVPAPPPPRAAPRPPSFRGFPSFTRGSPPRPPRR